MLRATGLVKVDLPSKYQRFTRAELITLRERAKYWAKTPGLSEDWARAFWALTDAADRLDAMDARTVIAITIDGNVTGPTGSADVAVSSGVVDVVHS
jgi:hypothetical protein